MSSFYRKAGIFLFFWTVFSSLVLFVPAQAQPEKEMTGLIQAMKKDPRGPFQAIKWFCPNGQVLSAGERCESPGGLQHGMLKDRVARLEQDRQLYLDLVLAGSSNERVWDAVGHQTRLKQYALVQYLFQADEGWIYRQARYYRGALQAEDETAWGNSFLKWLLTDPEALTRQFFQVREACRTIPHTGQDQKRLSSIRVISKTLSEQLSIFMPLRVKIHGRPDSEDAQSVRAFAEKNADLLDENQLGLIKTLVETIDAVYAIPPAHRLQKRMSGKIAQIPELSDAIKSLGVVMEANLDPAGKMALGAPSYGLMADLLMEIRNQISVVRPDLRLSLMNFSLELEQTLFSSIDSWQPQTLGELVEKCGILVKAAAGCGYMETWEWEVARSHGLKDQETKDPSLAIDFRQFQLKAEQIRRMVDWGTLMIQYTYLPEITLYSSFEPKANDFVDDRIRSSLLLPLGEAVGRLTHFVQTAAGVSHQLPDGVQTSGVRGLNPGIANGIFEVVASGASIPEMDSKKIYGFKTIPSALRPVAGMLSVSEGNLVSHIQLLARNLGIPNATLSSENLDRLMAYSGQQMFYAVSPLGSVVLKQDSQLTEVEKGLVQSRKRENALFMVPVEKINLAQNDLIPLSQIRASDSGRICGPKAANLGQLKFLFPDRVVDGMVIPFGIFRGHMNQVMPGREITYWQFLTQALSTPSESEADLLEKLAQLKDAISTMPFLPGFEARVSTMFESVLGGPLGSVPVFIRSDTNMEDIQGFTGAGLNLTLFNVLEKESLFQGIRDVWASPYGERSYLWRQKYLENPENVFPSILLLPSVNVDKSGVVITHGIISNQAQDITVAFSRGVGGAVDGQAAETYLLTESGTDILLYPSRETRSTQLPATGGIEKKFQLLDQPILNQEERLQIRDLVKTVRSLLPDTPGIEGKGPFDIELGFINGSMRLFQVRPFVENKRAASMNYLINLDKTQSAPQTILMGQGLLP
ncbi:MAG: PEP/pyruvate-binding domain-containing protein [Proteobacteria bacterium]|nr:phosphoenolpyruvate synthase [Desulfobacula sp.]MBU4130299.1 PEP/pyruvate-binding domain-containing protein [Pseudomonadota bacterium]